VRQLNYGADVASYLRRRAEADLDRLPGELVELADLLVERAGRAKRRSRADTSARDPGGQWSGFGAREHAVT